MKHKTPSSLLTKSRLGKIAAIHGPQDRGYLDAVEAFARLTYESVYVINYEDMSFEYVSDNPLFLCGYTAAEVLAMGYDFYFRHVPETDLQLLTLINETGFDFFDKLSEQDKKEHSITYDFHLVNRQGEPMLINHKLTPLLLTPEGKMWKAMCIVSLSHHQTAGNASIHKQGCDDTWQLDIADGVWRKSVKPRLSKREIEVLRLYAQGLDISEIATRLFVVPDTVKYYRRRIFERLEVSNMTEALFYAVSRKLI